MVTYKLLYFEARGRAELLRLIFAEAGVDFIDEKIKAAEWPEKKSKLPFGRLPILFIDDKPLGQSMVIARYLARQFDLEMNDCESKAFVDAIVSTLDEQMFKLPFMEKDEKKKAELTQKVIKENLHKVFQKLESLAKSKQGPFLNGETLCYGDLALLNCLQAIEKFDRNFPGEFPSLKAIAKRVAERPNVKKYLERRPDYKF